MGQMAGFDAAIAAPTSAGRTRFYVFTTDEDLVDYRLVQVVEARNRDHAIDLAVGDGKPTLAVAVSEHAFRVRRPVMKEVLDGYEDVNIPASGPPALNEDGADPSSEETVVLPPSIPVDSVLAADREQTS